LHYSKLLTLRDCWNTHRINSKHQNSLLVWQWRTDIDLFLFFFSFKFTFDGTFIIIIISLKTEFYLKIKDIFLFLTIHPNYLAIQIMEETLTKVTLNNAVIFLLLFFFRLLFLFLLCLGPRLKLLRREKNNSKWIYII
jgi:hypothetical protein